MNEEATNPGPCCLTAERPPEPDLDELAALAKALGHPVRVRILRILLERGDCVCGDLVECFNLAQSTVSQHLKVLKEAGLVLGEVDGPRRCYCADPVRLVRLQTLIADLRR